MKSFAALLILSIGLASAAQDELLCKCPRMYSPICGSNGVTYNNLCLLKCHQEVTPDLTGVSNGRCEDENAVNMMCACPRIYLPVCGSDGVTYNNPCLLQCQQRANKDLTITHNGGCEEENLNRNPCICTREFLPVCGSDGVTYANECMLKCKQSQKTGLTKAHFGQCETPEIRTDVCICTLEFAPVCGSDGVTYPNMCNLKCHQKNNNGLALAHKGECQMMKVEEDVCICTMEFAPVCGSDGVTYPNMCHLKCQQKNINGLAVAYKGQCQTMAKESACICTMEYAPVCGSDGVTYGNMCGLKCQQKNNNGLTVAHLGECQIEVQSDVCMCTMEYEPVCGSDGVTYPNMCSLMCKGKVNNVEFSHPGECNTVY